MDGSLAHNNGQLQGPIGQFGQPKQLRPGQIQPDPIGQLDLRDVHVPASAGLWPPAPGWWLLAILLPLVLGLLGRQGWRAWQRRRRRGRILAELDALAALEPGPDLAAGLSALLKRLALSRFPRQQVAALTGEAWLAFLDRTGGNGRFSAGPGRALALGPYAPAAQCDAQALLALARDWIRSNA
ncbi:DUF4381 domain-containing protein [Thiohalocapsa marina]|uniref:DUF4381 domain-containing protein n=1 Tax=Thiohalocapsa marina TaxID=424902 RepID=A0A5M8FGN9_9GAMM|nr:DUF4381 domain-containing protein [Thiohalocapsa marina]KAA6184028.1 DUF4381 domain-containing protein [Thiohalocapsa marina]